MPTVDLVVECPVHRSFRVDQVAGMFDMTPGEKQRREFHAELPGRDEPWQIGAIVGPSGSGKSTVARHAFGDVLCADGAWGDDRAVVDGFGETPIKQITKTLTAVGFSSPPAWLKPYRVLSNGEKFRCDLARALLSESPLIAYDEFTSVVDRNVAKIGSAAVAKAIRTGKIPRRFVAVTCHYDVLDWLEPDWVLDMASGQLARGSLRRRPEIVLRVAPVHRCAWVLFRHHHYLNTEIQNGARCFVAFWDGVPVAFSAWCHRMTRARRSGDMREHRTVVLPDFQGVGIGNRLSEFCASIWTGIGGRAFSTTSHPAMIAYRAKSPRWRMIRLGMVSRSGHSGIYARGLRRRGRNPRQKELCSVGRVTGGFFYIGPAMPEELAAAFAGARPHRPFLGRKS